MEYNLILENKYRELLRYTYYKFHIVLNRGTLILN